MPKDVQVSLHLTNPNKPHYETHVRDNAKYRSQVIVGYNVQTEDRLILTGAGPSLADDAGLLYTRDYDELWATNRSLIWLIHNGYEPTHAVWVDPGDAWKDEWADPPDVMYYVASASQPALLAHLRAHKRRFKLFHNWVGITGPDGWTSPIPDKPKLEYESWLYGTLYDSTVCTGAGLNAVNRALALALYRGFKTITVLGADCACKTGDFAMPPEDAGQDVYNQWLAEQQMYPTGGPPGLDATSILDTYGTGAALLEGVIDGRRWVTRPDMIISAVNIVQLKAEHGSRIELVGDTLPNAILGKPKEFIDLLPGLGENSTVTNLSARGNSADDAAELAPPDEPPPPPNLVDAETVAVGR